MVSCLTLARREQSELGERIIGYYFLWSIHLAAALHGDIEATDGPKKILEIKFMITWRSIKYRNN